MAVDLSYENFCNRVGETFTVSLEGMPAIELELVEVDEHELKGKRPEHVRQRPFSLLLRGPLDPLLYQAMYRLTHPEMGTLDLFLVPIGPEEGHHFYDVVIN